MGQRQSEIIKNHMEVYWHDYASASKGVPITEAGLVEKASVIGRTGLMLLECGTGAWRIRSSMTVSYTHLDVYKRQLDCKEDSLWSWHLSAPNRSL